MSVIDQGHKRLIDDLTFLLEEAKDFQFHDFKNETYAAPKSVLIDKLRVLIGYVMGGKYDNEE